MERTGAVPRQKEQLRRQFLARRDALGPSSRRQASAELCQRLVAAEVLAQAQTIAGYMALGNELDLGPYLQEVKRQGRRLVLPRVTGAGRMEFCVLGSWEELRPGHFGILEPAGEVIDSASVDVFLVPGVVFDRAGRRLGFGQGYYDRALPAQAQTVGIGYDWQVLDHDLPVEAHDQVMKFIATDQRWFQPSDHSQGS